MTSPRIPATFLAIRGIALVLLLVSTCTAAASTPEYRFRNNFWRNLHHLLYAQALSQPEAGKVRRVRLIENDDARAREMTPEQVVIWKRARGLYVSSLIQRDLLFDDGMIAIGRALSEADADADLPASTAIPDELRTALNDAAPLYRQYWWDAHRTQNDQWRRHVAPLLARHGAALRARLVDLLGAPWPAEPVTVDLAYYANPSGAYTSLDPVLVTIGTSDTVLQDTAALEILLHETAHGMIDPVRSHLARAAADLPQEGDRPRLRRDLWHQVQFHLVGVATAQEIKGYVPYADATGLWQLAWSMRERAIIDRELQPLLRREATLQDALNALVRTLAETPPDTSAR